MLIIISDNGASLLTPTNWIVGPHTDNDIVEYKADVLYALLDADPNYRIPYKFVNALSLDCDAAGYDSLVNLNDIENGIFTIFANNVTSYDGISFNSDNILFMFNVDSANYNTSSSTSSTTADVIFRTGVANKYPNNIYQTYDAYKIFDNVIKQPQFTTNVNFNISVLKQQILDDIRYDLQKNILLMENIYKTFTVTPTPNPKFIFSKLYTFLGGTSYDTSAIWLNQSLINNSNPALIDNFTSVIETLPLLPGELSITNLYHPLGAQFTNAINVFHNTNTSLYSNDSLIDYFNNLDLWARTNITDIPTTFSPYPTLIANLRNQITGSPVGVIPLTYQNTYFMNLIPLLATEDIPNALITAVNINNVLTPLQKIQLSTIIAGSYTPVVNEIYGYIQNVVSQSDDYTVPGLLNSNINNINLLGINRLNNIVDDTTYLMQKLLMMQYIQLRFLGYLSEAFFTILPYYASIHSTLNSVVNLFFTDINQIPNYTTFVSQNYNLTNNPNLQINTTSSFYSDNISSIWYNIFLNNITGNNSFINNYNNLFNNYLLGYQYYPLEVGIELDRYRTINAGAIGYNPLTSYDFYFNISDILPQVGNILIYLASQLTNLQTALSHYDQDKGILYFKQIALPLPENYFQEVAIVVGTDNTTPGSLRYYIETQEPIYYHVPHNGTPTDLAIMLLNDYLALGTVSVMDIHKAYVKDLPLSLFLTLVKLPHAPPIFPIDNPFNPITEANLYNLWTELWITYDPRYNTQPVQTTEQANYQFVSDINSSTLYNDILNINFNYNAFASEGDYYNYLLNMIFNKSRVKPIADISRPTVTTYYNAVVDYLNAYIEDINNQINTLNFLDAKYKTSLTPNTPSNSAWIKYLGFYLIEYVKLFIGDQEIDSQTGEWLHYYHMLNKRRQKERGYNILIGNTPDLYTYDTSIKYGRDLVIPLQFYFNKFIGNSLPLVALNHTDVTLRIKLRNLSEVVFIDTSISKFVKKPRLNCHVIGEYIYIENDERDKLVNRKNEYLIDRVQYNGEVKIGKNSFENADDGTDEIRIKTYFKNPVIDIVWGIQDMKNVANKDYCNYTTTIDDLTYIPLYQAKLKLSARDRETYKDAIYYNKILPYERYQSTPDDGIYVYPFALNPLSYQPSGSANLSNYDDVSIPMKLDPVVENSILNSGSIYRCPIYARSYDILRVMSGMAGLAFPQ